MEIVNLSTPDRVIRALVGVGLIGMYAAGVTSGFFGIVLVIAGAVFLATSVLKYCPIYHAFNWHTNKA